MARSSIPPSLIARSSGPPHGRRRSSASFAAGGPVDRMTDLVLRHRRVVVVLWLAAMVCGMVASGRLADRYSYSYDLPGQPGYEAAKQIISTYGNGGQAPPAIVAVTVPAGSTVTSEIGRIEAASTAVARAHPDLRVVDYAGTRDPAFLTRDGRTTFLYWFESFPEGLAPTTSSTAGQELRQALPGDTVELTGLQALSNGSSQQGSSVLAETLIGALGALAVLAFVFASFLAAVPLLVAAVAISSTFLTLYGLSYVSDVHFIVEFLVALVGLGVAIDYSLLLVTRWREERDAGADNTDAVRTAVRTAGHAVAVSGGTVAIGLLSLLVLPVPFLRSLGIGGLLIAAVSVLVTLTLLPAVLAGVGPRIDRRRLRGATSTGGSARWARWAELVVRRRWVAAGLAVALLGALLVPLGGLRLGLPVPESAAANGPARDGYERLIAGGVPAGVLTPIEVLTVAPDAPAPTVRNVVEHTAAVPGIAKVVAPDPGPAGTSVVVAVPASPTLDLSATHIVREVRTALATEPAVHGVGGIGAMLDDYNSAVYDHAPVLLAVLVLVTLALLVRAFRSVLLPVKAVLLNLVSVAATFGGVVVFWQHGHGSEQFFATAATGAITYWLPVLVFAFLYGLSMDYEVFILSRMREEYDRTGSTDAAVVDGMRHTGRLVTSAALIMFLALLSLTSSPGTDVKVFATALGFGVLLDAVVVRALLVPALVSLVGRWNWWLPSRHAAAATLPTPRAEVQTDLVGSEGSGGNGSPDADPDDRRASELVG